MTKLDVDKALIRELATLLEETGLSEIEVASDQHRLRVARAPVQMQMVAAAPAASAAAAPAPESAATKGQLDAGHPGAVLSPMVGTAYKAPEPGAAAFVNVGDQVSKGDTLLIIEAMKTFNEIPSPRDGTVRAIAVEDASPVEYGDLLMIVE